MSAPASTAAAPRLLGGSGTDRAAATSAQRGLAWGRDPMPAATLPALPPTLVITLLLARAALLRETWRFLRGLDPHRPLSPRQVRALVRIAARHGLGPVG